MQGREDWRHPEGLGGGSGGGAACFFATRGGVSNNDGARTVCYHSRKREVKK